MTNTIDPTTVDHMIRLPPDNKSFHCDARDRDGHLCTCNVFRKPWPDKRPLTYKCNACGAVYTGEE